MSHYPDEGTDWKGNLLIKVDGKITEKPYFSKKKEPIIDALEME